MRFVLFCPSGIVPAQFEALSTGSVCNITCIRTEEELRNKPYLNLAALNEFSDGNKVRLGDESVNASIDGAAFRVGAGVQADITKNMGAYASLDYTKGDDIENPLQGVVGINVTW